MHDSSLCPTCRALPAGGSLTDEEFDAFLATCRAEIAAKQHDLWETVGDASRWAYDMDERTLTIGDTVYRMTPIGTFSGEHGTWLWAWANEEFPDAARKASSRIQLLHGITGFRVFVSPGIDASPEEAEDLVALAVHGLGAHAFFRCPSDSDGPTLFLAIDDD